MPLTVSLLVPPPPNRHLPICCPRSAPAALRCAAQWFANQTGGEDPLATGKPLMDWNSWRGAPYVYDERLHPTAWTGATAVDFISNYNASDTPFFLKVSFHRPHSPYDPPERLLNATPASALPPQHVGGNWDSVFRGGEGDPPGCGPSDNDAWCGEMPADTAEVGRRAYYANIAFVDEWVGAVLDALDAKGLGNDTLIVFVSDHGDGQGDHYHWRKGYPYEFSAHVPMMVSWPASFPSAVPRGSRLSAVTELRDILPTMLDAAGVSLPPGVVVNGTSILCLLRSPADAAAAGCPPAWRSAIDLEHDLLYNASCHWSAWTDGRVKYVFNALDATEQLFNLTADPYEMTDVSGEAAYQPVLAQWRDTLVQQFEREGRGPAWVKNGVLQKRPQSQLYSPNYPAAAA